MLKKLYVLIVMMIQISPFYGAGNAELLKLQSPIGRVFSYAASSKPVFFLDSCIISKVYTLVFNTIFGDNLANFQYQQLGNMAQSEVGIPRGYKVPIKKFSPRLAAWFNCSALCTPGAIYLNEEKLDQASDGVKRFVLFHEAMHRKYNDTTFGIMLMGLICAMVYFMPQPAYKQLMKELNYKKLWPYCYLLEACFFYVIVRLISKVYSKKIERRADIEGALAAKCAVCVRETACLRRYMSEEFKLDYQKSGYLSWNDLNVIAQDAENKGLICPQHKAMLQ